MGLIDVGPRLDPQMRAAREEAARVGQETKRALGLTEIDLFDVPTARAMYDADRRHWNRGGPEMASCDEFSIDGPHGPVPVRLSKPAQTDQRLPVLVYLHGGGWIVGGLDTHDRICRILAAQSGWAVLAVDYRLAPEAKFPVPQEDCIAAVRWALQQGASKGLDQARVAVGGDSAGGNMTMTALLAMRDDGLNAGLSAGLCFYGSYGLRDSGSRRLWGDIEEGMTAADLAFYRDCLFADPSDISNPRFDILANDLSGLPPIFVLDVEMDPLSDDSVALTQALRQAGGRVRYRRATGVLHGYLHMNRSVDKARDALTEAAAFLRE